MPTPKKVKSLFLARESQEPLLNRLHQRVAAAQTDDKGRYTETAANLISLESIAGSPAQAQVDQDMHQAIATLQQLYVDCGVLSMESLGNLTDQQWQSGAVAYMAAANPHKYYGEGMAVNLGNLPKDTILADISMESFDYRYEVSQESFDDRELSAQMAYSAIFNAQAARQDAVGELLYKTVVVTPDMAAIDVSVTRTVIINEAKHGTSGKPLKLFRRNLIDAAIDPTILAYEATKCTPVFRVGDADNNEQFVATADITPVDYTENGTTWKTSFLKMGTPLNLIGISNNPLVLATGNTGIDESLDHRIELATLALKVVNTDGTSVIPLQTAGLPFSLFQKTQEGADRDMLLHFKNDSLSLRSTSLDVTDAAPVALTYLTNVARVNWIVYLSIKVNGSWNLQDANGQIDASAVTIKNVFEKQPDNSLVEITDATALANLKTALGTMELIGYKLNARRSGLNRRMRGIITDSYTQNERYVMPLGSPISCPTPVTGTRTSTDMAAPINVARQRNSNNAITKLFDYSGKLEAMVNAGDNFGPVPMIEGIGREIMFRPYYKTLPLNVFDIINSMKSHERSADVQAAMVNFIREAVYTGIMESGYMVALDQMTGGSGERPLVAIATDPLIERFLLVDGDTRTLSIAYQNEVASSMDRRMRDHIFIALVRPNTTGPDPLNFGNMLWMPELATNIQQVREGATYNEMMVQPRTLHINTCPWLIKIEVTGLREAVRDLIPLRTDEI